MQIELQGHGRTWASMMTGSGLRTSDASIRAISTGKLYKSCIREKGKSSRVGGGCLRVKRGGEVE